MTKYVKEVLISAEELQAMCRRLGEQISKDYAGKEIILIGVLKGAYVFLADLARYITVPVRIDFMSMSSYGSRTRTSGVVKILKDVDQDISGCHVLIVEDIVDSGLTLNKLMEFLSTRNPASLELCTAFDKPSRRQIDIEVKYKGMEIPNEFVVGYGLDYNGEYRNLPDVCILADRAKEGANGE
ncbi:MAG: hypoxanthine phosphoribosyltransferase [Fastidiosipilaceae bacterium]|nr:hypoxanthine phosphoribosyltransferase [Clostridiaceae bacterium]